MLFFSVSAIVCKGGREEAKADNHLSKKLHSYIVTSILREVAVVKQFKKLPRVTVQ